MIHQNDGGQVGKTISHYKILEKLRQKNGGQVGEGGMSSFSKKYNKLIPLAGGVVYKAKDTKFKLTVAPKFLSR